MFQKCDAIILGAGAAGLMCAMEAGKRGRRVVVLERAERPGKKILISGGGRCNFTNLHCHPENFLSANPHFAKSALARYMPADFIALVEKHHIPYHEKTLGQLFCDTSAHEIVKMLEIECQAAGVQIELNCKILDVRRPDCFVVRAESGEFHAPVLVVASGGLSIPKLGASSLGYELATQFGLKIQPIRPGLVPLVLNEEDQAAYCNLAGISAEVVATFGGQSFREKMLVTHKGLSGPAILQISSYWDETQPIRIDLAPDRDIGSTIRDGRVRNLSAVKSCLQTILPKRLAARWLDLHIPPGWTDDALNQWERLIHNWCIEPARTEGYEKAEVTAGGVDTDGLSSKSLESRNVAGLFFIGEVVDVTGQLGGFNFQWAWASGAAAGRLL